MNENEVLGVDAEAESGTESVEPTEETTEDTTEIILDTSEFASEIAVLEEKLDILTEQVIVSNDKLVGCYCMLLILAVLGLRNVFRSIIRKVMNFRGGTEDV